MNHQKGKNKSCNKFTKKKLERSSMIVCFSSFFISSSFFFPLFLSSIQHWSQHSQCDWLGLHSGALGQSYVINIFPVWASQGGGCMLPPWWRLSWLACGGQWDHPLLSQSLWISLHELIKGIWLLPHGVLIASMHSLTPLGLAEDTLIKIESMGWEK